MTSSASSPLRREQLQTWVKTRLVSHADSLRLEPVSGDAGFRSYYRVQGAEPACLAVDAPPATEKNHAFCHVAKLFRQYGIHAPQVYAADYEQGFLLLEDLGDAMYWPQLQESQRSAGQQHLLLYSDAERCLLRMASIPVLEAGLAAYDAQKLQEEMDLFPQWFVARLLKGTFGDTERNMLLSMNRLLVDSALQQPQVVVHRDFHCRNLMVTAHNNPGVIDFQDAVTGPITYDLVSLYRDCYIRWPQQDVLRWISAYHQRCVRAGVVAVDEATFVRWFDWMGLQRHIKVLGIFARLWLRDGKPGYLKDLPLVIHYTLSVARAYPEFADFVHWFEKDLLPAAKRQDWFCEVPEHPVP